MRVERSILIEGKDFGNLLEELTVSLGFDITGPDYNTEEGREFRSNNPTLFKLYEVLRSEVMKDSSTYNYERIKG